MTRWLQLVVFCVACVPEPVRAQAAGQVWGNVIVDWLPTRRLAYEIDVEPKAQLVVHDGQPRWVDLNTTPEVSYTITSWLDVLAQVDLAYQAQTDAVNNTSVAPRVGAELHLLSRILGPPGGHGAQNESLPRRRADFGTLIRLEHVHTYSSTDAPATSMWRLRDRFQVAYPLNRRKVTDDHAVYLTSDAEMFIPLDDDASAALVSDIRVRAGFGYRQSFGWRYEALYIWNGGRTAGTDVLAATSHVINLRVRHVL